MKRKSVALICTHLPRGCLLGGVGALLSGDGPRLRGLELVREGRLLGFDGGLGRGAAPGPALEPLCGDVAEGLAQEAAQLSPPLHGHAGDGREQVGEAQHLAMTNVARHEERVGGLR